MYQISFRYFTLWFRTTLNMLEFDFHDWKLRMCWMSLHVKGRVVLCGLVMHSTRLHVSVLVAGVAKVIKFSCTALYPLLNLCITEITDYGHLVRKSPSLHGQKSTPTPKFLGMAEAYFVCHISPNFQISLIYAFIGCP